MGLPPSAHDPQAVRDLADRILAQARYDRPPESLPERIQGWFADRIADVLATLVGSGGGTVVAWVVLVGAIGAVVYLVARHGRGVQVDRPVRERAAVMVELTRTPSEWRDEADRLEATGRWREGLRCRYRALVGDLVRRGDIADQAGRTAGEYVRDVAASHPAVAPEVAAATELFEAAWYGAAATGPDEAARFRELDQRVLAAGPRTAVTA